MTIASLIIPSDETVSDQAETGNMIFVNFLFHAEMARVAA